MRGVWGDHVDAFDVFSPPLGAHLVQVSYLVCEIVKLFDEKGLLPQGYKRKVGLGLVRLRGRERGGGAIEIFISR